ncbi:DUF4082 domain-containing protein [Bradyrhizobium neotropicale]|uniref:DUF4082 domain-containing protein n=1 Tax=Bradyrhizobium neotropicale TaxID=1497615 RepID=UPI001FEEF4CD|nr:DUF4082 domain-containing protein [Bradyrhizobium neotropicale]
MAAGVVSLSGTSTQNQTLAANVTDVDGIPVGAPIAYQWQQSADNGVTWTDIAGATTSSLNLQQAYVGRLVRAGVSYTDAAGNGEQDFSPATASVGNINDLGVASIVGTAVQGQTLTASVTDLDGLTNVAISYRWQQMTNGSWSNIANATAATYTLQAAQVGRQVRVRVTYTDQLGGSESNRTSSATPVIVATNPGGNDSGVVSLSGTPTQNQVLVANVTDVDGLPSATPIGYQWQQSSDGGVTWSDIAGATAKALTLIQAQVAKSIRAVVSYIDGAGSAESVASAATTAIANVNDAGVVAITGTPVQGQILKADVTDPDGLASVSITYRWQQLINATWSNIANATGATLALQPAQVGRQVRVLVSYTDQLGGVETNRTSAATPLVVAANNHPGAVSVSGTPTQNQTLTATVGDTDGVPATVAYQWQQSANGSTWTNISGATASTLILGQAQVGSFVRATATYTDLQGSSETPVSPATATAVSNVNDIGAVAINGTATQNQVLTATVTDLDGTPATIGYIWQSSPDGSTWTNLAATGSSLTLDSSLVGKRIRVNAAYTDLLGTSENVTSAATAPVAALSSSPTSLFTTQTPAQPNFTDGPGVDWELGMRFTSNNPGQIQAIRYYKSPSETGTHVGYIWSSTGVQLATVTFTNESASGWQQQALATPLTITAGTSYVVSVNTNSYYAITSQGFASPITNGGLSAPVGAGVYNDVEGVFPNLVYQNENYFRDVVFVAGSSSPNNHPGAVSVSGTPTQNQTLTATVGDTDGVPATVAYQWQQSANGSTWTNISGATASTLILGQAQVGSFVRATATYTDLQGSSETPVSPATATAVSNVNDIGAVAINGTATQNQVLTATVTDLDGTPATIGYIWQSSPDGSTWTNLAATGSSLTLDSSLVGKRIRVNAAYTDLLGTSENVTSAATAPVAALSSSPTSLFTTQTPAQPNFTDGPGVDWELGMRFTSNNPGQIQAIRYYKSPSETGTHVGYIWSSTGVQLATVTFTNESASGWQQQALATPLTITAGTSYVVSVNTNSYYAITSQGFASPITNGGLSAPVGAGVYNDVEGVFPNLVYQNENYFRDVVFVPGSASIISLVNNATIYVGEAAGTATITVARSGDLQSQTTVEYTTNEIGTAGAAQAGLDFIQPTFNGRANTGQVVFGPGESTKSFTIPIVNDQLVEGSETFAVGLQNPGSGSLGVPRTVLVTIVDDDSPSTISMADMAVSVSESTPSATLTLLRSGSIDQSATIQFVTSNGSAIAGSDYTASSGTVTFAAGQATQTISVPIINDTAAETDESFSVTLSNPTGATLGAQATTTVSILDNDNLNLGSLVRQTAVTGLSEPTAIDWTPDGRYMLVAQKGGVVRVVDNGTLRSTPLIDLSNEVNEYGDRGLLGIAINPNFASNPYVYLLYTYDPPETAGQTGLAARDQAGNRPSRLVRVTVNPATMVADPASELVLVGKNSIWAYTSRPDVNSNGDPSIVPSGIVNGTTITAPASQIEIGTQDNDPNHAGIQNQNIRDYLATDGDSHSIGAVHFGPDGYLYLTVGDGTSYNFADPRAVRVQDIHNLSGKLLRIDPTTGEGVPGNPYYQASDPNSNQSKIFDYGVRNAYRFSFDPITNLPVLGDVGWNTWEEIDTGPAGSNFGWPYLEGPNRTASYQDLSQAISFYNNGNRNNTSDPPAVGPILSRSHGAPDNASAITAGDFYNQNTLLFDDVLNGNIYAATLNASRQVTNVQVVDSGISGIVDLQKGPDGSIYGADVYDGTIRRWVDSSAASASALGLAAPSF